jgi:hypothetical protein
VALLSIPVLDGSHSRQYANQASAASKLREVTILEKKFAAAHADKGFTCEVPLLKPSESEQNHASYDPLWFLAARISSGYKFALGNCRIDEKGVVVHYQVTAVPVEQGRTRSYAFCADDAGVLWYDADGSATNCLDMRRVLQK